MRENDRKRLIENVFQAQLTILIPQLFYNPLRVRHRFRRRQILDLMLMNPSRLL